MQKLYRWIGFWFFGDEGKGFILTFKRLPGIMEIIIRKYFQLEIHGFFRIRLIMCLVLFAY